MKAIVPVSELGDRVQEAGRIRLGNRVPTSNGKTRPNALGAFRLTSPDEKLIRIVGDLYGGEPRPWNEKTAIPSEQWEVYTKATELRVFLPPGALSVWYEAWSGGGCIRRCDGRSCEVAQHSGDDSEMVQVPCLCKQDNLMLCKPHTRLVVILPELPFSGVWRCESKGWESSHTMPAMESLIAAIQEKGGGVVEAVLALEKSSADQGRKRFVVPRLRLGASALELAAGQASVGALHSGREGVPALPPAPEAPGPGDGQEGGGAGNGAAAREWYDADDEVVDAEIVEGDDAGPGGPPLPETGSSPSPKRGGLSKTTTRLVLMVKDAAVECGVDEELLRHALARKASAGATASSKELSAEAASQVMGWCEDISAGLPVTVLSEDPPKVKFG